MILCYIPTQTAFMLHKTLGYGTEPLPASVRTYCFRLHPDWFTNDTYNRMQYLTLASEEDTAGIQQLVILTQQQPEMLMLVLLRSLLEQCLQPPSKQWPFPALPTHEKIHITRIQFHQTTFTIAFQCVLNNKHNTVSVSLKDWHRHLLQILEDKRWLGVGEAAQLTPFDEDLSFEKAHFHVDGHALAWDQWQFLLAQGINPEVMPFQQKPIDPLLHVEHYRTSRKAALTDLMEQFNHQLSQAWERHQSNERPLSNGVAHLKDDLEKEAHCLESAKNTVNGAMKAIDDIQEAIHTLESDIQNAAADIHKKIQELQPIYHSEKTKSDYFFYHRSLDNQNKRNIRNKKALLALGIKELPPVKAISSEDTMARPETFYYCTDQEKAYTQCSEVFHQLQKHPLHNVNKALDALAHQTPLQYPLATPFPYLYTSEVSDSIYPFPSDEPSKPASIQAHYELLRQRYHELKAQWEARDLCFAAYKRCISQEKEVAKTEYEAIIKEHLLSLEHIMETLPRAAQATKAALNEAFQAYNAFLPIWKEKSKSLFDKVQALYGPLYYCENREQPEELSTLTDSCNTFLNQPQQWAAENYRYNTFIAKYDWVNNETLNSITSDNAQELFAIRTLLEGVANAFKEISLLDKLKERAKGLPPMNVFSHKVILPAINNPLSEASWQEKLNACFMAFKKIHYSEAHQTFNLSENTSALLEIYFEVESKKLLIELDKQLPKEETHLTRFWQLVMVSAIIPVQLSHLLVSTPHHRAYVFNQLIEKIEKKYNLPLSPQRLSQYIYLPQEKALLEVDPLSIKELPYPFHEAHCSIPLSPIQKRPLSQIRSSVTPNALKAWLYVDALGSADFKASASADYQHAHECFKGPQLLLALYYIELKVQEATTAYRASYKHAPDAYSGPLAEDFVTLIRDILHYPRWQGILNDNSEVITLRNPNNLSETREITALAFLQDNKGIFPHTHAAINPIAPLYCQPAPSSPQRETHPYPGSPLYSQDNHRASHDPLESSTEAPTFNFPGYQVL